MNVTLSTDVQRFVEEKVRAGLFASPDEAVNRLLSQVREQEALTPDDIDELRAAVDVGLAEADRGEFAEFTAEDIIAEGRAARARQQGR